MSETVWVSTTSHRSRDRLRRLYDALGREYCSWPRGKQPSGSYYQVPEGLAERVNKPVIALMDLIRLLYSDAGIRTGDVDAALTEAIDELDTIRREIRGGSST